MLPAMFNNNLYVILDEKMYVKCYCVRKNDYSRLYELSFRFSNTTL